jgi:hypothetical protein
VDLTTEHRFGAARPMTQRMWRTIISSTGLTCFRRLARITRGERLRSYGTFGRKFDRL